MDRFVVQNRISYGNSTVILNGAQRKEGSLVTSARFFASLRMTVLMIGK